MIVCNDDGRNVLFSYKGIVESILEGDIIRTSLELPDGRSALRCFHRSRGFLPEESFPVGTAFVYEIVKKDGILSYVVNSI